MRQVCERSSDHVVSQMCGLKGGFWDPVELFLTARFMIRSEDGERVVFDRDA